MSDSDAGPTSSPPPDNTEPERSNKPTRLGPIQRLRMRWSWELARRAAYSEMFARASEENIKGKLPEGEEVHLTGIWVAELYLPSSIDSLVDGIDRLGWREGRSRHTDLGEWITNARQQGGGGWVSLGLVTRPGEIGLFSERTTELPNGVKGAIPHLRSVSSGLSALVVLFLFEDDAASEITRILNRDYAPRVELTRPRSGSPSGVLTRIARNVGWHLLPHWVFGPSESLHYPDLERRRAVNEYLRDQRVECSRWVANRFPGAFSGNTRTPDLPAFQFLVTEAGEPFHRSADRVEAYRTAGLSYSSLAWKTYEWPAVRMTVGQPFSDRAEPVLTFACRRSDSFDPKEKHRVDQSDWSIARFADMYFGGLLVRWASSQLLVEHRRRLALLRDLSARNAHRHGALRTLKRVRQLLVTESLDVEVAAQEIRRLASSESEFHYDVIEFLEADPTLRGLPRAASNLVENLRTSQLTQAEELVEELRVLVGSLSTASNITAAISNVRLQRIVVALAAVSIAIASWAAVRAADSGSGSPTSHEVPAHTAP